jgi:ATP-dependent helicase Lhr and Lhr-like helicase
MHPFVAEWFNNQFKGPTEIQSLAWPRIAAGANVLVTAPTGTGKTLTVFLTALDRLIQGAWECGAVRVLYISPLKALNNDIRENLVRPLSELKSLFEHHGEPFPDIRAVTRSGDTPQSERQRMLKKPPEILITTPESLNLLLSSPKARIILSTIETVIIDEIHAVAAGKRGTHLITAVERLTLLSGEFQRIAVSATVRPLSVVADFVGGYRMVSGGAAPQYEKRPMEIIEARGSKNISLRIEYPLTDMRLGLKDTVWEHIAGDLRTIIKNRSSTLVFVNSRRLAENLTHIINSEGERLAYAHHGSLSREIRRVVEKRLKEGELSAIVATASLELGIDIGELDQVVLIQTPFSVSQAVQRIGRSGHSVNETSTGVLYPSYGMDLIRAAVMAELVMIKDVEEVKPVSSPLDVLSQVLVSMLGIAQWKLSELYAFIRCAGPFHDLAENSFRSVIEMLAGRYRDTRIRELNPRILVDPVLDTARARNGALLLIYSSGGTIPDRGYFSLRIQGSQARVGELDEEFVWERKTGDTFTLGTQNWKVTRIDHQKVEVVPWRGPVKIQPFWKGESAARDSHFSAKIAEFLESCSEHRDDPGMLDDLRDKHALNEEAGVALLSFLSHQVASSGAELPHRHHILIEHSADPSTGGELKRTFIHTLWGNRVNYPLSLVLGAICERNHFQVEVMSDNDLIMLQTPGEAAFDDDPSGLVLSVAQMLVSVEIGEIDDLIRQRLERGGYFGSRFRENAGRALLLPRGRAGKRTPLWVNRLKARKLMDAVRGYRDFPILVETWRTCIQDEFELDALKALLQELRDGEIRITEVSTEKPSPFAEGSIWQATNHHLYGDDTPTGGPAGGLSVDENILKEVVFAEDLRPELDGSLVHEFGRKVARTEPGYAPAGPEEVVEWVGERLLVPISEWETLLEAVDRDHGILREETLSGVSSRCFIVTLPGAGVECVVSVYGFSLICEAFGLRPSDIQRRVLPGGDMEQLTGMVEMLTAGRAADDGAVLQTPESIVGQWLCYYGPVPMVFPSSVFGTAAIGSGDTLLHLAEERVAVIGHLTAGIAGEEICDAENLEKLLAFARRQRRQGFEPQPVTKLISHLAHWQQVDRGPAVRKELHKVLAPLLCYPSAAGRWEEDILPARIEGYQTGWLDELLHTTDLEWAGCGAGKLAFCFPEDVELFHATLDAPGDTTAPGSMTPATPPASPPADSSTAAEASRLAGTVTPGSPRREPSELFSDPLGRYTFWDLKEAAGLGSADFTRVLWDMVWDGNVRCDSFEVVRNGILQGFKTPVGPALRADKTTRSRRRTAGLSQWKVSRPMAGNWYLPNTALTADPAERDLLDEAELNRDRIRLLLTRYGVLFRELLVREAPPLRWGNLFRTMRLMELSGEIIGGHFFDGVPGIQFALPAALNILREKSADVGIYLLNAADPASLCGVDLPGLKSVLPERFPSTYIICDGDTPVITARKRGGDLEIAVPPDHPDLYGYIELLRSLTRRSFSPVKSIKVRTVNGEEAIGSEYGPAFEQCGFLRDYQGYSLWAL